MTRWICGPSYPPKRQFHHPGHFCSSKAVRPAVLKIPPTVSDSFLATMAEELPKTRLGLKSLKLVNCLKAVKLTITVDQGSTTTSSEKLMTRQVTHLKAAWEE